jgi:hypothetical protein
MTHVHPYKLICSFLVVFFATLLSLGDVNAQSFVGGYGSTKSPKLAALQDSLRKKRAMEDIAASLSRGVKLSTQLTIGTTECGSPNAFYTPSASAIVLCLELIDYLSAEIPKEFSRSASPQEIGQIVSGTLSFILFHELGHALIHQLNLPILGREEDAADQIGAFFLLRSEGAAQSLAGAIWFFRQREMFYTRRHFAGEHSLGPQRQSNLACWAYGSNQTQFSHLLSSPFLPRERATRCDREYQQLESSVRRLLSSQVEIPSAR